MGPLARELASWPRRVVAGLIRAYQLLAAPLPSSCRYTPSCSTYTLQAVWRYGAVRGSWLGMRRILRCHPFRPGGYDPVP